MVKAELKNYRQSPRKVRLVADLVRGKKVRDALNLLIVTTKRSSTPLKKLIESAVANAKHNFNLDADNLFIKEISVNAGVTMHRWTPRAHGSSSPLRKRVSRVVVVLDELNKSGKKAAKTEEVATEPETKEVKAEKAPAKKATKKPAAKKVTKTKK